MGNQPGLFSRGFGRGRVRSAACAWLFGVFASFSFLCASAHEVGLSTGEIRPGQDRLEVHITLAVQELESDFALDANKDSKVTQEEFASKKEAIERYLEQSCFLHWNGQRVQPASSASSIDTTNNINLALFFPVSEPGDFRVRFDLITDLASGHRMFVTIFNPAGAPVAEQLLTQSSPEISFSTNEAHTVDGPGRLPSFIGFVKLGVEHIGTGYDHLLFLFALLLVTRDFRSSVAVITFFTIAHSVTLAVATFDLVNLPGWITEPLIAATIIYVGVENILRKGEPHGRWALTFCFGLVHGFGFASILREMGVGAHGGGVAMPLLGFNLGVELGQLAVAAVLLPFIWKLRARPVFLGRVVPACSAGIALLGGYWLVERLWG